MKRPSGDLIGFLLVLTVMALLILSLFWLFFNINFNNEVERQSARLHIVSEGNIMEEKLLMLPGPTQVPERVLKAMTRPVINHRGDLWRELYRKVQKGLKLYTVQLLRVRNFKLKQLNSIRLYVN